VYLTAAIVSLLFGFYHVNTALVELRSISPKNLRKFSLIDKAAHNTFKARRKSVLLFSSGLGQIKYFYYSRFFFLF